MNYTPADDELLYDGEFAYDPQDVEVYEDQVLDSRPVNWMWPAAALLLGTALQMIVQKAIGPVLLAPLFLGIGLGILALPGLSDRLSRRAFVLTFCTCVFVAGVNQLYQSLFYYDPRFPDSILYSDENTFYHVTRSGLTGESFESIESKGHSPGPIIIWQALYTICKQLRLGDGNWIGVMLNCLIVGLVANITVRTARHLFGDDEPRLRRVGTLFALCGMFWLYGTLFLRDSFALILVALVLWALVRATASVNVKNLVIAAVTLVLAVFCMRYVRRGVSGMFLVFGLLALLSLTRRWRSGAGPLAAMFVGLFVSIVAFKYISPYVGGVAEFAAERALGYAWLQEGFSYKSLANKLVVSQIMPIRLITGSLYMLIYPIPLWAEFQLGRAGYWWMTGWNGLFIVLVAPAAFVGFATAIKQAAMGGRKAPSLIFVTFFMVVGLLSIAATSLKARHMGQFWPAFLFLAAIPDLHDWVTRRRVINVAMVWLALIVLGHVLWAALKIVF